MAQMVLIMGESGTGKSTSIRNCDPAITGIINPVGKPLPFKGHFDMFNSDTDAKHITDQMKAWAAAGKKLIIIDDFQYILAVPYMNRIKESGWDKYNDFGANYFEIIDVCKDLPDDVVVVYMTHLETLDNGLTTVKLIGKLLREKITIEGLFSIVLRTGVNEGKYYFFTQNSGKDTVKSPLGMFPAYAIDNDLNYVVDKIRNYYEVGDYKTDDEMTKADQEVSATLEKPDSKGRRSRTKKTRSEVQKENEQKEMKYVDDVHNAIADAADGKDEMAFEEAAEIMDTIPQPETEKPPRRTRKQKKEEPSPTVCGVDTYFYLSDTDNYVLVHEGDPIPENGKVISKEEFIEGCKRISEETAKHEPPAEPEAAPTTKRRRRTRA